ncbi:hypothetical protein OE749_05820 [Aestuariibacter sp. AA17]|uniref:Uncharacterized protein n=1 Tax=Fluctibacter corallii TaxID=2984329 RepID=A0ABT3A693_9ALTE|nr:hypothetical protein [Aestuariibacter sp. AA17]MCV2884205.1 hypothetical protein [Aestuariibacter sp. AA17]
MLKQTFPIIALILILSAVYLSNQRNLPVEEGTSCQFDGNMCNIRFKNLDHSVRIETFPPKVEEMTQLTLSQHESVTVESAWVEGVNMYMGKTHLPITHMTQTFSQSDMFLGACNEPEMTWRIVVNYSKSTKGANNSTAAEPYTLFYYFTTRLY